MTFLNKGTSSVGRTNHVWRACTSLMHVHTQSSLVGNFRVDGKPSVAVALSKIDRVPLRHLAIMLMWSVCKVCLFITHAIYLNKIKIGVAYHVMILDKHHASHLTFVPWQTVAGGVPLEDQKNVLAVLAWGVHQFLQEVAEEMGSMLILTALTSYLQASFPLPVDTHLLLAHALENLGSCHSKLGNTLGARDLIKQALCLMFDLAIIGDKLTCSQQICTLKGILLHDFM